MNFREPLETKLKKDGHTIESKVIDLFYLKPTPIKDEEIGMYKPYLVSELKKFSVRHYEKEFGDKVLTGALNEIVRKHPKMSTTEVKYVLSRIIELDQLKPFNLHELNQALKRYESDKNKVAETYHHVKKLLWKKEEEKQMSAAFLHEALKLNSEGKHITIYHKARIGRHATENWTKEQIKSINEEVDKALAGMVEKLSKRRKYDEKLFFQETVEMNTPMMWTPNLLFGVLAFETLEKKKSKKAIIKS